MKKRNSLSYETLRSLFDPSSPEEAGGSYFRIGGGESPVVVNIPTSLMHRLFRLGQAYGLRQLRYFESDKKLVVGTYEIPEFVNDLQRLRSLLNDEVLHDYIDRLVSELQSPPGLGSKHIAVSTGEFFKKRDW